MKVRRDEVSRCIGQLHRKRDPVVFAVRGGASGPKSISRAAVLHYHCVLVGAIDETGLFLDRHGLIIA